MFRRLAAFLLALLATHAHAASFDCTKAGTRIEKLVCADPALGALDERLAAAYHALGSTFDGKWSIDRAIAGDQRHWLGRVRDRCADAACLQRSYATRLDVLEHWNVPAAADASIAGQYFADTRIGVFDGENWTEVDSHDCLALKPEAHDVYSVQLLSYQANGHSCALEDARMRREGDQLRLVHDDDEDEQEKACDLRLRVTRGAISAEDPGFACRQQHCGMRAGFDIVAFPRGSRDPKGPLACWTDEGGEIDPSPPGK
jgi:uncharacterized protein